MNEESCFAAALERPTGALRRAFLDEACAGDAGLRERVDRLLAAHDKALGILDQPAPVVGMEGLTAEISPSSGSAAELAGALLAGRYRLIDEIGEGGMGSVWKAEQLEPVRRNVAIKLIKAGMDS